MTPRRTRGVNVRLDDAEYTELVARATAACYRELAAYVRTAVLAQRAPRPPVPELNRQAWAALANTATDLQQLLAHLVTGHRLADTETEHLAARLDTLAEEVRQLRLALLGVRETGRS